MELNLLWMVFIFMVLNYFLAFSKNHSLQNGDIVHGFIAAACLIIIGVSITMQITYTGWTSTGVGVYTMEDGDTGSALMVFVGGMFAFIGMLVIAIVALLTVASLTKAKEEEKEVED